MKRLLTLFVCFLSILNFSQDLKCEDFKSGRFYIPMDSNNDTLYVYNTNTGELTKQNYEIDKELKKYIVIRSVNEQVEWHNGENVGNPIYEDLIWVDDCSYILKFSSKNEFIDEESQYINDVGGLKVDILFIEENCMKYKATLTLEDATEIYQFGYICKEL